MAKNQGRINRYIASIQPDDEGEDDSGQLRRRDSGSNITRRNSGDHQRRGSSGNVAVLVPRGTNDEEERDELGELGGETGARRKKPSLKTRDSSVLLREKFHENQTEVKRVSMAMDEDKERQAQRLAAQLAKKKAGNKALDEELQVLRLREEKATLSEALRTVNTTLDEVRDLLQKEKDAHSATLQRLAETEQAQNQGSEKDTYDEVCRERDELKLEVERLNKQLGTMVKEELRQATEDRSEGVNMSPEQMRQQLKQQGATTSAPAAKGPPQGQNMTPAQMRERLKQRVATQ